MKAKRSKPRPARKAWSNAKMDRERNKARRMLERVLKPRKPAKKAAYDYAKDWAYYAGDLDTSPRYECRKCGHVRHLRRPTAPHKCPP